MEREREPTSFPSVSASDLDALYHENTGFEEAGRTAERFKNAMQAANKIVERAISERANGNPGQKKRKFRKLEVFALVSLVQDLTRLESFKLTTEGIQKLAAQIVKARESEPAGRITSGRSIEAYYRWWRDNVATELPGVRLDSNRLFSEEQKATIRQRDGGKCSLCREDVPEGEAEYDHFPIPHRDGGRTEIENGRLVHRDCHPRGRPLAED